MKIIKAHYMDNFSSYREHVASLFRSTIIENSHVPIYNKASLIRVRSRPFHRDRLDRKHERSFRWRQTNLSESAA